MKKIKPLFPALADLVNPIRFNRIPLGLVLFSLTIFGLAPPGHAEDKIELETIVIRGNKELPKILYIVPWGSDRADKSGEGQKLVLHSLFGDLFDPILPEGGRDPERR